MHTETRSEIVSRVWRRARRTRLQSAIFVSVAFYFARDRVLFHKLVLVAAAIAVDSTSHRDADRRVAVDLAAAAIIVVHAGDIIDVDQQQHR
jgi:hypothetical protein